MTSFRKVAGLGLAALFIAGTACAAQGDGGPFGYYVPGPIRKLPDGGRPLRKIPFPAIVDKNTVKIALARTPCFGNCPGYSVEISADGTVRYDGGYFVAISGKHEAHVPVETVRALYDAFVKADFFWTVDEYRANISDLPTYTVTISFDDHTKKVIDYAGQALGMPKEIGELENAIDATAETTKWVKGDENTFASLEAEHWDFRVQDDVHLGLIESAATRGNLDLVRKLLMAGVRVDTVFGCKGLQAAAYEGSADVVKALTEARTPVHWDTTTGKDYDTGDALSMAALSGMPGIVRAILDRHPDVNWRNPVGTTPLMSAAAGYSDKMQRDRDFAAVVRMLIDAGADVNLRDEHGESAIMRVQNPDAVRALLAAGATDINRSIFNGQTVLMRSFDPEVTQALLEGGADPWIVDKNGKNAFESVSRTYGARNAAAAVLKRWMTSHPKTKQE
jgi:ankyrin repeat protein